MEKLEIIGIDQDKNTIICQTADKTTYELAIDEKLYAATKGDVYNLEKLTSADQPILNPKLIQQRIRTGESLTTLAEETGYSLKKIERYAYPIQLEMEHIVALAKSSPVHLSNGKHNMSLENLLVEFFTKHGISNTDVVWKATKETNQNWLINVQWGSPAKLVFSLQQNHSNAYLLPVQSTENFFTDIASYTDSDPINTIIPIDFPLEKSSSPKIPYPIESGKNNISDSKITTKSVSKKQKRAIPTWDEVLLDIKGNEKKYHKK